MQSEEMFNIDLTRLSSKGLNQLLRKRLLGLMLITESLLEEEQKLGKAREVIAASNNPVRDGYWELTEGERKALRASNTLLMSADPKAKRLFQEDLVKRAQQIVQIGIEMRKKRMRSQHIDLTKLHPKIQQVLETELAKISPLRTTKKLIKAPRIPKIKRRARK